MPLEAFDCQKCGACCRHPRGGEAWATVTAADLKRLPKEFVDKFLQPTVLNILEAEIFGYSRGPVHIPTKLNRQNQFVCVAFRGTIGKKCSCFIYASRPKVCRVFRAGSKGCKQLRQMWAER